jgi:hypothetical protein
MTTKIQKAFFDVVNGRNRKYKAWLAPVGGAKQAGKMPKPAALKTAKRK